MRVLFLFSLFFGTIWQLITSAPDLTIIGGHEAVAGQYPFMAAINVSTSFGQYFCGGTLISDQWIATAGQCVFGAILFTIELGSNKLKKPDDNRLIVATYTYVLHPEFDSITLDNDIGLIKLRSPLEFTDYITPITSLPTSDLQPGTKVVSVGWGQTSDVDPGLSENLKFVAVSAMTDEECQSVYGHQFSKHMTCAQGNYNEGTCNGDTGAPLVGVPVIGHSEFVAIASFVSSKGCESTDPSGFTKVYPYVDWIRKVTNLD